MMTFKLWRSPHSLTLLSIILQRHGGRRSYLNPLAPWGSTLKPSQTVPWLWCVYRTVPSGLLTYGWRASYLINIALGFSWLTTYVTTQVTLSVTYPQGASTPFARWAKSRRMEYRIT